MINEEQKENYQAIVYKNLKLFLLTVMLSKVPPQRSEALRSFTVSELKIENYNTVFFIKHHKTMEKYGPITLCLPSQYYKYVQSYLKLLKSYANSDYFFVNESGYQDFQLTNQFKKLCYGKFKCIVTIQDMRPIFITHASKDLNMTEMYQLSERMYHSFDIYTSVFRM